MMISNTAGKKLLCGSALALVLVLGIPSKAFAACSTPTGNAGDIVFSSSSNTMAYCNGTFWVAMGSNSNVSYGTLTTNAFCVATSGTAISCTTVPTGTGNIVLASSPTLTGTVAGANSTWTGQVAVGTTTLNGALNVSGTINATTFTGAHTGSGSGLTGIGTASLGGITGTASSSTYLRGDGTWATASSGTTTGTGAANYLAMWTGTSALSSSAIYQTGGNVGIGTTSPGTLLDMYGGPLRVQTGTNGAAAGYFSQWNGAGSGATGVYGSVGGGNSNAGPVYGGYFINQNFGSGGMYGLYTSVSSTSAPLASYALYATNASTNSGYAIYSAAGQNYFNGNVGIGTTSPATALQVNGTATATTFSGSGASLTGIGTSNMSAITGTASSTTFLAGNGVWTALTAAALPSLTSANIWVGNVSNVATGVALSGDCTITNAGAITCTKSSGTAFGALATATTANLSTQASGTLQAAQEPAHTGDVTNSAGSLALSVGKIQGVSVGTPTGTGNVVMSASPTLTGTITAATANFSGPVSWQFATDYSTATSTQSDVAINTSSAVRYTGAGSTTFYGIAAGTAGQILYLTNAATSTNTLTLSNQSASDTTAASRIVTGSGADMVMANNSSIILQYDGTAARWRVIGGSGGATPAGATGQLQYNSGSNSLAAGNNFTFLSASNELVVGTSAATPAATTGTVASYAFNVIPQAVSVTPSGVTGGVALSSATAGQMAYYSGASAIAGTSNLYVSGSNIGIGTSSPAALLTVGAASTGADYGGTGNQKRAVIAYNSANTTVASDDGFVIRNENSTTGNITGLHFSTSSGATSGAAQNVITASIVAVNGVRTVNQYSAADLAFLTSPGSNAADAEHMRLTAGGYLGIGTTIPAVPLHVNGAAMFAPNSSPTVSGGVQIDGSSSGRIYIGRTNADTVMEYYYVGAGRVGSISVTSSATSYNTGSDRRLKENFANSRIGLDALMGIPVKDFNFIADKDKKRVQGFIAQDLYKVYPEAVTTNGDDGLQPLKDGKGWTVDYGRVTPLLAKAIQELKSLFDTDHDMLVKLKADNDSLRALVEKQGQDFEAYKKAHP